MEADGSDESPLSLPSQWPLSQDASEGDGGGGLNNPDRPPPDVRSEGRFAAQAIGGEDYQPEVSNPPHAPASDEEEPGELAKTKAATPPSSPDLPEARQTSVLSRRGRRDPLQQAVLEELLGAAGGAHGGPPGGSDAQFHAGGMLVQASEDKAPPLNAQDRAALVRATVLSTQQRQRLIPLPVEGWCPLPPFGEALAAASAIAEALPAEMAREVLQLGSRMLAASTASLTSKTVLGDITGMGPQKLDTALSLLASTVHHSSRAKRWQLEEAVALQCSKESLLLYTDFCAYDETPLPVMMRRESGAHAQAPTEHPRAPQASSQHGQMSSLCSLGPGSSFLSQVRNKDGLQKVVQTVQQSGMLLQEPSGGFVGIICPSVCPLAVLDRCTAPALRELQERQSPVSRAATCFRQATRAVCTDRNAANLGAEREVSQDRGLGPSLHVPCDIHKTASCYSKTFCLTDGAIKGMINTALALKTGSSMTRFRQCLREEVASRFVVKTGQPSLEATTHKRHVLRTFVRHGSSLATRRVLLSLCPNGDWRSSQVEHYVAPEQRGKHSNTELLEHVTVGLIVALCSTPPQVYPRHRWTGADLTMDRFGIIEACHKLLSTTMLRFGASYEPESRACRLLSARDNLLSNAGCLDRALAAGALGDWADGAEEHGDGTAGIGEVPAGDAEPHAAGDDQHWAAANTARRRAAMEWVCSGPMATLFLQRLVVEPLRRLLTSQFAVAGEAWDDEQLFRVVDSAAAGRHDWSVREFRLTIAACGDEEQAFFDQLRLLRGEVALWSTMPVEAFTVKFRALAFKMISRSGCCVAELLQHPHRQMPYQLFALLRHPERASELLELPDCRWDAWSRQLRELHPDLCDEACLQKLAIIAHQLWTDISRVESKHASIRRLLTVSSVQTHQQSLEDLSSQWVFLQARKLQVKRAARSVGLPPRLVRDKKAFRRVSWLRGSLGSDSVHDRGAAQLAEAAGLNKGDASMTTDHRPPPPPPSGQAEAGGQAARQEGLGRPLAGIHPVPLLGPARYSGLEGVGQALPDGHRDQPS